MNLGKQTMYLLLLKKKCKGHPLKKKNQVRVLDFAGPSSRDFISVRPIMLALFF
jgi:hypothetical protein